MGSRIRETVRYLFELYCEVSSGSPEDGQEPYIVKKYPETYKNEEELKNIPKFTFPCPLENSFAQHYSFVLTSVDSKYTFGFCRYDPKTKTSLVLLSHLPWHDIFYKLLNNIVNVLTGPRKQDLDYFLEACRMRTPMPGHTLKVSYDAGHSVFICQYPDAKLPSIPENCNLTEYFSAMDSNCMAGLWAALLNERRIAIVASKLSRLSACVQAANATLFPMSWQHIFIPILPKHLVDYLLAPMPFLIGVPRHVMENVRMSEIGDVVVLDVDANELRSPFQDLESLPSEMVIGLKKALSDKNALGDAVSRAFLRALVCLIGGYRDAIKIENGHLITFNPDAFVRTRKDKQPFLKKILQSQIFQQFIDERLEVLNSGRGFSDEFEVECSNYDEQLSASGHKIKYQYKGWAKNVKKEGGAFFKTVKDKANPAVQSAVKSVRQGGKNVKSAVKGLKSKIPTTGSRPSSNNTTDDSRYSCGSATPVSSDSSDSAALESPPRRNPSNTLPPDRIIRAPPRLPPTIPLDLLFEMEYLFTNDNVRHDDIRPYDTEDLKYQDTAVHQEDKNEKSADSGLKSKIPTTGSQLSSNNTTDDSRYSCGSAMPVSDSLDSAALEPPPRRKTTATLPPRFRSTNPLQLGPTLPLMLPSNLFAEMESLFGNDSVRRDALPNSSRNSDLSSQEKAKTLSPCPPRLAERPQLPDRYPIISTSKLIDLSDAPTPPPRAVPLNNNHIISNITKNDVNPPSFHTTTIYFAEGNDKPKLKLTMSSNRSRAVHPQPTAAGPCNGSGPTAPPRARPPHHSSAPAPPLRPNVPESCGSDTDLIKLEDSPSGLEEFDPLKARDKSTKTEQPKNLADSELLQEYGLDFSSYDFEDYPSSSSRANDIMPRSWTLFN